MHHHLSTHWKEKIKSSSVSAIAWKLYSYYEALIILKYRLLLPIRPILIKKYLQTTTIPNLQIGAGLYPIKGWLNTDLIPRHRSIMYLDARAKFPFDDNMFQYIFTEHVIEHISFEDSQNMLQQCLRILQPGGIIRIATPDMRFLFDLYGAEKTATQRDYIEWSAGKFLPDNVPPMDTHVINNFFRAWGHQFIYDWKSLENALTNAGFVNVTRCDIGESQHTALQGIEMHGNMVGDKFNRLETIIVEAQKPF